MDDTARASHSVNTMRAGNVKLAALMLEKQLESHPKKSDYLIFGSEAFKSFLPAGSARVSCTAGQHNLEREVD